MKCVPILSLLISICSTPFSFSQSRHKPSYDFAWQYSVPLEAGTERRAYLWIPPNCRHVRGVLFGLQNMLERSMFEDAEIRAAASSSDMAIVLISPGSWPDQSMNRQPSLDYHGNSAEAIAAVQHVLKELAHESGYTEIEFAPIALAGHSAASPFVWGLARTWPERVFAFLPFKGYHVDSIAENVPTLKMEQEWGEWGPNWGEVWRADMAQAAAKVKLAINPLFGDFTDIGSGHFDWNHEVAPAIAMFLRKAAAARLPENAPLAGPVALKAISAGSGVLVDPRTLGTADYKNVPYAAWQGDPKDAFWYFDGEMADAVNRFMLTRLQRKPEAIDFVVDGNLVPLTADGFAVIRPQFQADGITFRVHAITLEQSPSSRLFAGAALGHSSTPITYRVSSGAIRQVGPDTFQMSARSGGLTRQGQPWEPWIMAEESGDAEYRAADRPAHILIDVRRKNGAPQTLAFAKIRDVRSKTRSIPLSAQATSGLPVQLYVESGPAVVEGNQLRLLPVPPRSRYPVRIIVSAYQWGRDGDHPIQSAGPETQEFFLRH